MSLSRSARSLVASLTIGAFLLCYLTGAAIAWQLPSAATESARALVTCHTLDENGSPEKTLRGACDEAQYVSETQKHAIAWPLTFDEGRLLVYPPPVSPVALAQAVPIVTPGAFPPLRLLHCRFLN
jgi:hypothetical protein